MQKIEEEKIAKKVQDDISKGRRRAMTQGAIMHSVKVMQREDNLKKKAIEEAEQKKKAAEQKKRKEEQRVVWLEERAEWLEAHLDDEDANRKRNERAVTKLAVDDDDDDDQVDPNIAHLYDDDAEVEVDFPLADLLQDVVATEARLDDRLDGKKDLKDNNHQVGSGRFGLIKNWHKLK